MIRPVTTQTFHNAPYGMDMLPVPNPVHPAPTCAGFAATTPGNGGIVPPYLQHPIVILPVEPFQERRDG